MAPTDMPSLSLTGNAVATSTDDGSRGIVQVNLTSKTGRRARQNWRSGISSAVGSLRRSNTTSNPARLGPISTPIRRQSINATEESPTDPALTPAVLDIVELPASPIAGDSPVTGPDEQRSFLDLDSDDSEDEKTYTRPIISRASSVRVQRPTLVQNHSADFSSTPSGITIDVYNGDVIAPRPSIRNAPIHMSTHAEEQPDIPVTPATETTDDSTRRMGPEVAYRILTANATSAPEISRFSASTIESSLPSGVDSPVLTGKSEAATFDSTVASESERAEHTSASDQVQSPLSSVLTPTSNAEYLKTQNEVGRATEESVVNFPSTITAQIASSSPFSGVESTFKDRSSPLQSNPVDTTAARLHRTISSPLPHQNPNRKVTIRPSDLVTSYSKSDHRILRDEVVSTPYPARMGSMASPEEALAEKKGLPRVSEEKDRFPSPDRPETLVLQLAAARHVGLKKTIAIEVTDKGTFDDAQLFKAIQRVYSNDLLGPARRVFSARQLSHATFCNDIFFDTEDFIKHLKSPTIGHKRKGWLLWLRQHQPIVAESPQTRTRDSFASYYSPSTIPRMPFQRNLPQPPKIVLHFEFSVLAIALAVVLCLLFSCLATVLWVLGGVPGFDVGARMDLSERSWRSNAEGRVLTGLVLGLLVLALSSLGSAVWIGGSYILL